MEMAKSGVPGKGLGETLVEMKMVTPDQLKEAIRIGGGDEHKLGKVLVEQGVLNASDIAMARSFQLGIAFFSLKKYEIASEALRLIPEQMARKYNVVPSLCRGCITGCYGGCGEPSSYRGPVSPSEGEN